MKKKILVIVLAVVVAVAAVLVAVNMNTNKEPEKTTIKIGASSTPHAEILEFIKPMMAEKGYEIEVVTYLDYTAPNMHLSDGSLNANYFQHIPYMTLYNETLPEDQQLVPVIGVHYEPYGVYPGTVSSFGNLQAGDTIAIPNDPANEARALNLLANAGLITLKEGVGISATVNDIESEVIDIEIYEVEAAQLPRVRQDVAMAVINGNYAIEAGLSMNDALAVERTDDEVGVAYTNYIVIRPEDVDAEWVKVLADVITSQEVADFINNNESYAGGVIPSFIYEAKAE